MNLLLLGERANQDFTLPFLTVGVGGRHWTPSTEAQALCARLT